MARRKADEIVAEIFRVLNAAGKAMTPTEIADAIKSHPVTVKSLIDLICKVQCQGLLHVETNGTTTLIRVIKERDDGNEKK